MSVIPLILTGAHPTVVTTEEDFERQGARQGRSLLVRNCDANQLDGRNCNASYDLRVGVEYSDHRDKNHGKRALGAAPDKIRLLPGGAVIVQTMESLHVPKSMFGYVVPRVWWLQRGLSNTMSKVDPGYNGFLLVTVFNLGLETIELPLGERFCSLVVHDVDDGVTPYDGDGKRIEGEAKRANAFRIIGDWLGANGPLLTAILILLYLYQAIGSPFTPFIQHLFKSK